MKITENGLSYRNYSAVFAKCYIKNTTRIPILLAAVGSALKQTEAPVTQTRFHLKT